MAVNYSRPLAERKQADALNANYQSLMLWLNVVSTLSPFPPLNHRNDDRPNAFWDARYTGGKFWARYVTAQLTHLLPPQMQPNAAQSPGIITGQEVGDRLRSVSWLPTHHETASTTFHLYFPQDLFRSSLHTFFAWVLVFTPYFWGKCTAMTVKMQTALRQPSSSTIISFLLCFAPLLCCPFVQVWYLRQAFCSAPATEKIHKSWQWRMTPCQLAALTKDRGLFLLTHKCKASRTRTPTYTKQLVLRPYLRHKGENQICSHPSAFTAVFCSDLKLRGVTLRAYKFVLSISSKSPNPANATQTLRKESASWLLNLKINTCN